MIHEQEGETLSLLPVFGGRLRAGEGCSSWEGCVPTFLLDEARPLQQDVLGQGQVLIAAAATDTRVTVPSVPLLPGMPLAATGEGP